MEPVRYEDVPNRLTLLRLVLAGLFFLSLNQYRYGSGPDWALWTAIVLFVAATLTDFLDGYLARRWQVESTFGRIMDPFCDKVLVLGAFVYLAGPRFVDPGIEFASVTGIARIVPRNVVSGIYPWMVALIIARELLVTSLRGELESRGRRFGASTAGKLKMILQSVAIPVILFGVWLDPNRPGRDWIAWAISTLAYTTILFTVASGWPYARAAVDALGEDRRS